jgi:hypothetical protein
LPLNGTTTAASDPRGEELGLSVFMTNLLPIHRPDNYLIMALGDANSALNFSGRLCNIDHQRDQY